MNLLDPQNSKNQKFVMDKIFHPLDVHFDTNSLSAWLSYYYSVHVKGAPEKTEQAKKKDLSKFILFFQSEVGHDNVSIKEIFRYAKPSQDEMQSTIEELFERDYINASILFEPLAKRVDKNSKSLQRMFSASGNPTAQSLFSVIHVLQEAEGIKLTVSEVH